MTTEEKVHRLNNTAMHSKPRWIAIVVLVLGFAVVDLLLPTVMVLMEEYSSGYPDPFSFAIFFFGIGIVVGQVALLATWSALGRGSLLTRLLGSLALLIVGWYTIMLGHLVPYFLGYRDHWGFAYTRSDLSRFAVDPETAVIVGSLMILGFFFFQGLLWILRGVRGWRIGSTDDGVAETQFSIRQLMIWTAVVAILITLGQLVLPSISGERIFRFLGREIIAVLISTTAPLILALVCSRLALEKRIHVVWVTVIVAVSGLFIFLVQLASLFLLAFYFGPGQFNAEEVAIMLAGLSAVNAGHLAAQFGTLLLFRLWGYRLTDRKQRMATGPEPSSLPEELSDDNRREGAPIG